MAIVGPGRKRLGRVLVVIAIDFFAFKIGKKGLDKGFLIGRVNIAEFDFDVQDFSGFCEIKGRKLAAAIESKGDATMIGDFA